MLVIMTAVCLQACFFHPVKAEEPVQKVKELNFVFLHGLGGTPCAFQGLQDQITETMTYVTERYREQHPDVTFELNMMVRCYPGYESLETWAENIAESINTRFAGKDNIILVGHSMGGKTALYTVAHNIGGIADRVEAVITINSPIKKLSDYYVPGGGPMVEYMRTVLLGADMGVVESVAFYDSSADGLKISQEKHWLAFISAENSPVSPAFDNTGVDIWPRNLDDGVVPLSAQFSEGADVIYYGQYQHSDASRIQDISKNLANAILLYIFGYPLEFSVPARSGTLKHEADWLIGTDRWADIVGGIVTANGTITHKNTSFYKWRNGKTSSVNARKTTSGLIPISTLPRHPCSPR